MVETNNGLKTCFSIWKNQLTGGDSRYAKIHVFVCLCVAWWRSVRRNAVYAQDAKLIEAAKKEGGKVVVYGSLENDTMDLISAAFKKKTGIEVDFWREAANKVMDRAVTEYARR